MSPLTMSTLSAVLQKHRQKLPPVWNQQNVRKMLKVNVLFVSVFLLGFCCRHSETFCFVVFLQEDFVCSRRQSRDRRLRILLLLRGVDLLPAQGSSSSVVLMNILTLLFYLSCDLLSVGHSDSDSEMELRLKEAAVSVQDLLPALSSAPSKNTKKQKEVADGDESHVVVKKKKKKKGHREQKDSAGSPHHAQSDGEHGRSEQEVPLKVRRKKKKKREGNTEEEASD